MNARVVSAAPESGRDLDPTTVQAWLEHPRERPTWPATPDAAIAAAALAELPGLGIVRLANALLHADAITVWEAVRAGRAREVEELRATVAVASTWARQVRDPARVRADLSAAQCTVVLAHDGRLPKGLALESTLAPLLYIRGKFDTFVEMGWRPAVSIVGTRRASAAGRAMARELGRGLAARGIDVVSGLAAGIDAAAHAGTLAASAVGRPFAVVGSGPDTVYPAENTGLWRTVGSEGLIVSEVGLGTRPAPFRFPLRNRLIAAWGEVTVVVESHHGGGSLITAKRALERNRTVLVVPGTPLHPATHGSNRLIREDGVLTCTGVDDIVAAMAWSGAVSLVDTRGEPDGVGARVLAAMRWTPCSVDDLVSRTGLSVGAVSLSLADLEVAGWVREAGGRWRQLAGPGELSDGPGPSAGASGAAVS